MGAEFVTPSRTPSDVPDVLAPGLAVVFCGINPGRVSAAAGAHFANPRNDFWRLLHDAGFTPRLYEPHEQFALLELGIGVTNAAYRTTKGSGDLRRGDFAGSARRLEQLARDLSPRALAFVGKEAFRGAFGTRPDLGPQAAGRSATSGCSCSRRRHPRTRPCPTPSGCTGSARCATGSSRSSATRCAESCSIAATVCCSCSSATAAVRRGGRRRAAAPTRASSPRRRSGASSPRKPGSSTSSSGRRSGGESTRSPGHGDIYRQRERYYLVRVDEHEPAPTIDLAAEHVHDVRWWTLDELDAAEPGAARAAGPRAAAARPPRARPAAGADRRRRLISRRRRPPSGRRAPPSSPRARRAARRSQGSAPATAPAPPARLGEARVCSYRLFGGTISTRASPRATSS